MKQNFIGGRWVDGANAVPNINPSDLNDVIDLYAHADVAQAREAVAAASAASAEWAASTPQQRFDVLDRVGTELLARSQELGDLLAREEGKTLPEAMGEVTRAGQIFKFFAGEALRLRGDLLPSVRPGISVEVTREPLGVVTLITPWNFPIAIPAWKIAPALAFGNSVVFKPAELVPGCAWALAEILSRSGLPAGAFNLVMGPGAELGGALIEDRRVHGVSFTGSQTTGRRIAQACTAHGIKFQLEMGGKNPLIVLDDADLAVAVNCAVQGAFFSTGQRCTATSRIIVTDGIHDRFVQALTQRMAQLRVGDARTAGVDLGPVVDERQLAIDLGYIASAQSEGATLAFGGQHRERDENGQAGFFLTPALFTDTHPDMRINSEEVFGPVATVQRARHYDEALALANNTPFGLSSGLCTTSLRHATHFKRHAQAGMVMVNTPTAGADYHVPFGGRKASSMGAREQGAYANEFYTTVKTAYTAA
ncbi:aldehyde dehydrogenase family protein [Curvibacter sp. RS43]|uniref:aldehyde dehydrogenase family protein n=1 Tax=Curvibacter microcysteis TaxID=3026419 RepID=UPI0023609D4F|nr:aldehyde dehydrogenase family protein [Curvibacter sp. RS43]MDD0808989.1 aldehyde dehydrogenase family protein [Curvibacter sp. RS43]